MDIDALAGNIALEVRLTEEAKTKGLPLLSYSRQGDAGIDLRSVQQADIPAGQRVVVPTGLHLSIPSGFVGFIKDRSGLASREGIHIMAGVIDSNYRGEVKVVVLNTSAAKYKIEIGERIAQMLILPLARVNIVEKDKLDVTNRNENGWGSSGKN